MKKVFATLVSSSILAAGILAASAPAKAGTLTCPSNLNDNVTGTSGCEYSTTATQDYLNTNPLTVNAEGFFGFTNWAFAGRTEYSSNAGQSGTWNISNLIQNSWDDIMLVFKSGNNTGLVGYMVADNTTSGTWTSPFEKPPFTFNGNDPKDVSHLSVYYRVGTGTPQSVPEPGSLVALSLIGGAMVLSRRYNASKTA
jgi:hypothetical protein